jgi:hypothetical protein
MQSRDNIFRNSASAEESRCNLSGPPIYSRLRVSAVTSRKLWNRVAWSAWVWQRAVTSRRLWNRVARSAWVWQRTSCPGSQIMSVPWFGSSESLCSGNDLPIVPGLSFHRSRSSSLRLLPQAKLLRKQEVLGRTNSSLSFDRHGPYRKRNRQQGNIVSLNLAQFPYCEKREAYEITLLSVYVSP